MPKAKEYAAKQFYWRGRTWTIRALKAGDTTDQLLGGSNNQASLFPEHALIVYRDSMNDDLKIQSVLHEAGHAMFPEWSAEPHETALSEVGIFERDLKAFLEAAGVDLTPLIK